VASDVVILVCDEAGRWRRVDRRLRRRDWDWAAAAAPAARPEAAAPGPVAPALVAAIAAAAPADVVLMSDDCDVADGWLDGLREAAYSDGRIATASAMAWTAEELTEAAATVRARSLRLRPSLPGLSAPCLYIRRSALDLAGPLDPSFRPGAGEERGFATACVRRGLRHVLADDVLVASRRQPRRQPPTAASPPSAELGPLTRSLSHTRRVLHGPSVLIDARVLTGPVTGTHVHLLELIGALARSDE
jgi:hypothetical protein